jgi:hypothetical protein
MRYNFRDQSSTHICSGVYVLAAFAAVANGVKSLPSVKSNLCPWSFTNIRPSCWLPQVINPSTDGVMALLSDATVIEDESLDEQLGVAHSQGGIQRSACFSVFKQVY